MIHYFVVLIFTVSLLVAPAGWAGDEQEMEPELIFMPQAGPPRMVPKGSQGLTPVPSPTSQGQEMEPELIFMPQSGPPRMVPKGSQGLTPVQDTNFRPMMPQNAPIDVPHMPQTPPAPLPASTATSFSEVTGLELEQGTVEYRTGSDEAATRKIPGVSKFQNVKLKKGDLENIQKDAFKEADDLRKSVAKDPQARDMAKVEPPSESRQYTH